LETFDRAQLRAWIEAAEARLAGEVPAEPTTAEDALHGPDGAIAYQDGAAYLPTPAAVAWYEALPKPKRPAPEVLQIPEPEPVSPARRRWEPVDEALRGRYYALKGAAAKAYRAGNVRQARNLERQADELLKTCAVREVRPAPKTPPLTSPRASPSQVNLFAA
jgi:hypothetical protein